MKTHRCYARGCHVRIGPELLMCSTHWRIVPKPIQERVWREWRHVQADPKGVLTPEYIEAINAARGAVIEATDV